MMSNEKLGTVIYGPGSTPALDSSGERVLLEGIDISTLTLEGFFNHEHKNDNANQIVGRITEAKKIFKKEDCSDKRQLKCWDHVGGPFLFIAGVLFDSFAHEGAKAVAAMLKFDNAMPDDSEQWPTVGFSIEGSKLAVKDGEVQKCIARAVSITMRPCNKQCRTYLGEANDKIAPKISFLDFKTSFKKSEELEKSLPKSAVGQKIIAAHNEKRFASQDRYVQGIKSANSAKASSPKPPSTPPKTVTSKVAQPLLTGDAFKASIQAKRDANKSKPAAPKYDPKTAYKNSVRETVMNKAKVKKEMTKNKMKESINSLERFAKKDELIEFIESKYVSMNKSEIMAIAAIYALKQEEKQEAALLELLND